MICFGTTIGYQFQKQTTKFLIKNRKMINKADDIFESKEDFELFVKTIEELVVVIIEANWCGCCQIMVPVMEKLSNYFKGKIRFITIGSDVSENLELNFDSDVLPKILFFNKGRIVDKVFGTASFEFLQEKMKTMLAVSSKNNMYNLK